MKPSTHSGMGAIYYGEGVAFRVWAPHADMVYVTGSFNDWDKEQYPLASEGNGYWSGDIDEVKPGDEYRYRIVNDGEDYWRIDPYSQAVTNSVGNSIVYHSQFEWTDKDFQRPSFNTLVIYEMHVGTFNDVRPGDGLQGDLQSAIKKLPYLNDLGVNAIELMPVMEFPGAVSWGYNPAHIFAIESDYGDPDELKKFINAAHNAGIAVLFDVVYNHLGPNDLSVWQFDGWREDDRGGIYFYQDERANTPWGNTRPDYGRPEVRQFLRDNALFWLKEYHVDGIRFDGTIHIRNYKGHGKDPDHDLKDGWSLLQWINDEIDREFPERITIAEDFMNNEYMTKETQSMGAGFDSQWDGGFVHPVRETLVQPEDQYRDLNLIADAINHKFNIDAFERIIYIESHDEVANGRNRIPEEIDPGQASSWAAKKLSSLGAALVFTSPGIPMIFQGQEFLEDDWFHDQDPVDWSKFDKYNGLVQMFRDLISLRLNHYGIARGLMAQDVDVYRTDNDAKVLAFHRYDQGGAKDSVVVVLNFSHQPIYGYSLGLPREGIWKVRLNSDSKIYDPEFGDTNTFDMQAREGNTDGMPFYGIMDIGPFTCVIFSQDQ